MIHFHNMRTWVKARSQKALALIKGELQKALEAIKAQGRDMEAARDARGSLLEVDHATLYVLQYVPLDEGFPPPTPPIAK